MAVALIPASNERMRATVAQAKVLFDIVNQLRLSLLVPHGLLTGKATMRVTATCSTAKGFAFQVDVKASTVNDAIDKAKAAINKEFDYCFEADKWLTVQITIERG